MFNEAGKQDKKEATSQLALISRVVEKGYFCISAVYNAAMNRKNNQNTGDRTENPSIEPRKAS